MQVGDTPTVTQRMIRGLNQPAVNCPQVLNLQGHLANQHWDETHEEI